MKFYSLSPQDAWFFRDGRPYNDGEKNQTDAISQFPPSLRAISGAVRAALARANGWNGKNRWDSALNPILGDGAHDLGALQFFAPFLIVKKTNSTPATSIYFPAPANILGKTETGSEIWTPKAFLRPAPIGKETLTDLGKIRLPEIFSPHSTNTLQQSDFAGLKPAENQYISTAGLSKILAQKLPDAADFIHTKKLWSIEQRVAIKRNENSLQVEEGNLFSPAFVRLHKGVSLGFGLSFNPEIPLSNFNPTLPTLFPFGGESRLARCEELHNSTKIFPEPPPTNAKTSAELSEYAILTLTPTETLQTSASPFPLPFPNAEIISACLHKPLKIGGWDSLHNTPLPLQNFHPAGSIWFCKSSSSIPSPLPQNFITFPL